jgi:alpha-methylacyl-CoA racemase
VTPDAPPLAGLRVVEFLGLGPAPFGAMLLADLGADVLAVARPGTPHPALADNRAVLEIDLKSVEGRALARRLADAADVLVEGFRPGVLERSGLGPQDLAASNPRLVYAGALHHAARAGEVPTPPSNLLGDFGAGGMYLVTAVLAALLRRERSGRGEVLDVAIVDGTTYLTAMLHEYRRRGSWSDEAGTNRLDTGAPFYDVYRAADGGHVAIGALEPQFFAELVRLLGLDPMWTERQSDRSCWPRLRAEIAAAVGARTRDEWAALASDVDACLTPVLSLAEAAGDPHLRARGVLRAVGPAGPGAGGSGAGGTRGSGAAPRAGWRPELPGRPRPEPPDPAAVLDRWAIPLPKEEIPCR